MRAFLVALLAALPATAGCVGSGAGSTDGPGSFPTVSVSAHFRVVDLTIRPENDTARETLYEDDGAAIVRYVLTQPADAPRQSAFVTYLLDGRIVNVEQIALEPGEERAFERRVEDLRTRAQPIAVEVRAGSSSLAAEAEVLRWPRAGQDALAFGPLTIRADYGLLEQDGRVLVNLSLAYHGPEETFDDLRVKMLCVLDNGSIHETRNTRVAPPAPGNATSVDVLVEDCHHQRYGLEFKANGVDGVEMFRRLLLVPRGWTPAPEA